VGLAVLLLAACSPDPQDPEQQIRQLIESVELAIEQGELGDAAQWLDEGYSDRRHRNKRAAVASLFAYTRRHKNIHLFTRIHQIEVAPDASRAVALVDVAMTATPVHSAEELLDLRADLYRFDLKLAWDDDQEQWRIRSSQWRRSALGGLMSGG